MIGTYKKKLKNLLLTKLLKGRNVSCNICNKDFTTFIPHMNRINACCPSCGSLERTRLLWYFMMQKGLLNSVQNLLHVAPEHYLYKLFTKKSTLNYYPIDKFTRGYQYPLKTVDMDVTTLQYEDGAMDAIICLHVLEHVLNDKKALQEFYRVLKPNGWAIVLVPYESQREKTYEDVDIVSAKDRFKHFGQSDHVRIYGIDFIDRFKSVGFEVEDWKYQDSILKEIKDKYVFNSEGIFLLRKSQV